MTMADVVSWLLAVVFFWAGALNLVGPAFVRAEFAAWGYPAWLRIGVGLSEWLAGAALIWPATRLAGALLGAGILIGVVGSLARARQGMRLEYPLVLLALVSAVAFTVR